MAHTSPQSPASGFQVVRCPERKRRSGRLDKRRVPDLAGFMNLIGAETKVGGGWSIIGTDNNAHPVSARLLNFAALLGRVVLIGKPDLGRTLDLQRWMVSRSRPRSAAVRALLGINPSLVCNGLPPGFFSCPSHHSTKRRCSARSAAVGLSLSSSTILFGCPTVAPRACAASYSPASV